MENTNKINDFEQNIIEAKEILNKLSEQKLSLSSSMKLYEQGNKLLMSASKIISEAKMQFCELNKREDGDNANG